MIDLNDVWSPPPRIDLAAVKAQLAATAADWLPDLFPQARLAPDRRTLRCADLSGRPPRKEGSCVLHLDGPYAGWGFDFSTGERAGPVDLIYHATGLTDGALFEEAARLARMDRPSRRARRARRPDHTLEVRRILDGCLPLAGSPAETYLRGRGLSDPALAGPALPPRPDRLRRRARLAGHGRRPAHAPTARRSAASTAPSCSRTARRKAPAGKKMLGSVADGAVRLFPIGDDGHLGIAEGIETALSAQAIFGVPVWAALSADGVARWQWPAERAGASPSSPTPAMPGRQAAARLADRLNRRGHPERDRGAAPWRRLQRRPAARRRRGGLWTPRRERPTPRRRRRPVAERAERRHASAPSWKPRPRR